MHLIQNTYNWETTGEVGVHVVPGLEGLQIYRVFTHFELPYACVLTGIIYLMHDN